MVRRSLTADVFAPKHQNATSLPIGQYQTTRVSVDYTVAVTKVRAQATGVCSESQVSFTSNIMLSVTRVLTRVSTLDKPSAFTPPPSRAPHCATVSPFVSRSVMPTPPACCCQIYPRTKLKTAVGQCTSHNVPYYTHTTLRNAELPPWPTPQLSWGSSH